MNWNAKFFLENWMSLSSEHLTKKRLIDTKIPGSHDSNTYTLKNQFVVGHFGTCQNIAISEQLKLGVRYIDIRYGEDDNEPGKLIDQHGPLKGDENIWKHFIEIAEFCHSHPKEFILINFQNESSIHPKTKEQIIWKLNGILGDLLVNSADIEEWFDLSSVTFEQIWQREKRVLLLSFGSHLFQNCGLDISDVRKLGILSFDEHKVSEWHNVNDVDDLLKRNLEQIETRPHNKIFVSQFILTAESDFVSFVKNILLFRVPTIFRFVERLLKASKLHIFFIEHLHKNFNVILLDFVNFDIDLLFLIIASNFSSKLTIHKAFIGSKDFTDKISEKISIGQVLYIPCLFKLCKILNTPIGTLTLVYSYGNSPLMVAQSKTKRFSFLLYNNPFLIQEEANEQISRIICFSDKESHILEIYSNVTEKEEATSIVKSSRKEPDFFLLVTKSKIIQN